MDALDEVRVVYVAACQRTGVEPCPALLNHFRKCAEKKKLVQRLCITHGSCGDGHVAPIIACLQLAPSVADLALHYIGLSDAGCCDLLAFLAEYPALTCLELFGNQIGNRSCSHLPAVLRLQRLTQLKLGDNAITSEGAWAMADGLRAQQSLAQLHLGGNNIGDDGLIAIVDALWANTTLTSLSIRDNGIGPRGIRALADLLGQSSCALCEVQLKGNAAGDEGAGFLAAAMTHNTRVKVLELQANGVGPLGAVALCDALLSNTGVYAVNLNDNKLGDEGAQAVAALLNKTSRLTTLGVHGNGIDLRGTAAIARALSHNTSLTGLDLGNNRLGDRGIGMLATVLRHQNTTLASLDVHMNNVTERGVFSLTRALLTNTFLRHLDFGSNYSRNSGARHWAAVIRSSTTLIRLCLTDNEIGIDGGELLLQATLRNSTLRNFQFGGQSQVPPLANHIALATRRDINSIVLRNKRVWDERQALGATTEPWTQGPGEGPEKAGSCLAAAAAGSGARRAPATGAVDTAGNPPPLSLPAPPALPRSPANITPLTPYTPSHACPDWAAVTPPGSSPGAWSSTPAGSPSWSPLSSKSLTASSPRSLCHSSIGSDDPAATPEGALAPPGPRHVRWAPFLSLAGPPPAEPALPQPTLATGRAPPNREHGGRAAPRTLTSPLYPPRIALFGKPAEAGDAATMDEGALRAVIAALLALGPAQAHATQP